MEVPNGSTIESERWRKEEQHPLEDRLLYGLEQLRLAEEGPPPVPSLSAQLAKAKGEPTLKPATRAATTGDPHAAPPPAPSLSVQLAAAKARR